MSITKDDNYYKHLQEVFSLLLEKSPSISLIKSWHTSESELLQGFCASNAKIEWLTGIGVIEAVFLMVDEAYDNNNI